MPEFIPYHASDVKHLELDKALIAEAASRHGHFAAALGNALTRADGTNSRTLLAAFADHWARWLNDTLRYDKAFAERWDRVHSEMAKRA